LNSSLVDFLSWNLDSPNSKDDPKCGGYVRDTITFRVIYTPPTFPTTVKSAQELFRHPIIFEVVYVEIKLHALHFIPPTLNG
jgi:hypothetical protein